MKEAAAWTMGLVGMAVLGYVAAFRGQDLVWLLVPGAALIIAFVTVSRIFR